MSWPNKNPNKNPKSTGNLRPDGALFLWFCSARRWSGGVKAACLKQSWFDVPKSWKMKIPPYQNAFCNFTWKLRQKICWWKLEKSIFVTKIHPIVRSSSKIPAGVMLSTTGLGAWGFLLLGGSIVWKPRKLPSSVERTRETTAINRHFLDDSTVSLVSLCWTNRRKFGECENMWCEISMWDRNLRMYQQSLPSWETTDIS